MRSSVDSLLFDHAPRQREPAIVCHQSLRHRRLQKTRWSYEELAVQAIRFSHELRARSIGSGDRVIIQGTNGPEWVASFYGCLLRGAVVVPLDLHSLPDFVGRVQHQVSAKLALGGMEQLPHLEPLLPTLPLERLPVLLASHPFSPLPEDLESRRPDRLAEIIFTSGTTAEPKGVCLTHANLLANILPLEREIAKYRSWERLVHPLRLLSLLPLSHVFGQFMGIFVPALLGTEVHFQESLNPTEILETISRERISVVATPATSTFHKSRSSMPTERM